jgi:hypothetical protein
MRRCTYCFRFHPGSPVFCSHCGRSFGVRICSRGHRNARGVAFCAECGSPDLSTPAPPASLLHHLSGFALYVAAFVTVGIVVLVIVVAILHSINWSAVLGPLFMLVFMVGFLYWTTTLLPGPIRKVGKFVIGGLVGGGRKEKRH